MAHLVHLAGPTPHTQSLWAWPSRESSICGVWRKYQLRLIFICCHMFATHTHIHTHTHGALQRFRTLHLHLLLLFDTHLVGFSCAFYGFPPIRGILRASHDFHTKMTGDRETTGRRQTGNVRGIMRDFAFVMHALHCELARERNT